MIKQNISKWYIIGLAVILIIGCLMIAVGSTWARYRTDYTGNVKFKVETPANVILGTYDEETETFTKGDELVWTETEDELKLDFAISNDNSSEDQILQVRMIASLNAWNDDYDAKSVVLSDGTEEKYTMQAERIGKNTSMYYTFGDGWIFRFFDEEGKEAQWLLKGGKISFKDLDVTIDNSLVTDVSIIQLQIYTDYED